MEQQKQRDELFRTLFAVVRDDHPEDVSTSMENIMCVLLDESEEISEELLLILLSTLGRSTKGVSDAARKLAMNIIESCAAKLEPVVKHFLISSMSENDQSHTRIRAVNLVGELFAIPGSIIPVAFQHLFVEFLKRLTDRDVEVRMTILDFVKKCLRSNPSSPVAAQIFAALCDRLLDYDENVRKEVVDVICDVACFNLGSFPIETTKLVAEHLHDKFVALETLAVKVSENLSHPLESGEFQDVMNEASKQDGPPLCEDLARKFNISNGEQKHANEGHMKEVFTDANKDECRQKIKYGSKPELDDWVRGTSFNKGLVHSTHTPVPVIHIHKAERKYEIGKVTDEEQAKQRKLKSILNKLTPQNFYRLFEQVKEVNIDNVITLVGLISQIFDKAITEPIFCEMYANFCQHLASCLPSLDVDNKITFRRFLLNKCQQEFEREREEQEDDEVGSEQSQVVREEMRVKVRRRMVGNISLIGELYKKRMLTERIMHECIKKLLGQYEKPDEWNIEALCKLMSIIGEMIDHPKAKNYMDAYFDTMSHISCNMKLSSRVRFMLKDAIDLRKNKWQQRRKIEGPKKIEEVHHDAAQESHGQVNRLSRNTSMNSGTRRGQPLEFDTRGSMLSSSIGIGMSYTGMSLQESGFGGQDTRMDGRNICESGTLSVPLLHPLVQQSPTQIDYSQVLGLSQKKIDYSQVLGLSQKKAFVFICSTMVHSSDRMEGSVRNPSDPIDIPSGDELEATSRRSKTTKLYKPKVTGMRIVKRQRRLSSPVWDQFDMQDEPDINGNLVCKCKKCAKTFLAESKNGTGNLIRHLKSCKGKSYRDIGQFILHNNSGSLASKLPKFNIDEFRQLVAIAIAKHNLPLQLVEYEGIRNCFSYLNPDVKFFVRNTIKSDILKMYGFEKEKLILALKKSCGRISLTSDCWTSVTTDGYMSLTAHFIDENWSLQKRVLNFTFLPPPHSGAAMSVKVTTLLKEWGIENRIMSITLDNASANDSMVESLKPDLHLMANGAYFHVRCCAHILNLIVQEGLKDLDDAVVKVRESVKYSKGSQSRKQRFLACVGHVNLESVRGLRQDVPTRWNSTYHMLDSALYYRRAFKHLAKTDLNYLNCPTESEWDKIEKICKFLKVFNDVTRVFSGTKFPTANLYFTHVLRVRLLLKEEMGSRDGFMKNMATKMFAKFDKYWSAFSTIMAIAVIFDPRYKFNVVDWAYKKIFAASYELELEIFKDKLFELFNEYVSLTSDCTPSSVNSNVNAAMDASSDTFMMDYDTYSSNAFTSAGKSELELYLEEPILPRTAEIDVLEYWKTHCVRYPLLSQMVRDILAIPISTVASESTFSIGGRILDPYRSSLKPSTVEALVCLRDWAFDQVSIQPDVEELCGQIMKMKVGDDSTDPPDDSPNANEIGLANQVP